MSVRRRYSIQLLVACATWTSSFGQSSTITLRGGYAPVQCVIESVTLDGVVFTPSLAESNETSSQNPQKLRIPLGDCVEVMGNKATEFAQLADTAATMWRARSRLNRNDVTLAEPLFESLAALYDSRDSESAVIVLSGLLECELRQNKHTDATDAWFRLADVLARRQQRQPGSGGAVDLSLTSRTHLVDDDFGLCASIPPIWLDTPALQGWSARPGPEVTSSVAITLQQLYQTGASAESGFDGATLVSLVPTDPIQVRLVHDIITSRIGSASERSVARDALQQHLQNNPPDWLRVWCQAAIGRSLVMEDDIDTRWQGVVELLRLPAEMPGTNRYLTGVALAEAAVVSAELGDTNGATRLRAELVALYPDHPATHWLPIREWNPARPPASTQ